MKIIIAIFLSFITFKSFGQIPSDTTGIELFNKGIDYYNKGELDSTLFIWTTLVDKGIGKNYDIYGNAFFNIPTIYWQKKEYQKAKDWYKRVLNSDLRDNDETGLLMEPHTNYKHKSAMALAGLYEVDSSYTETLEWLYKADTVYRYWGFEGSATSISKNQSYLLSWKTEILLKLKQKDKAIRAIVLELICSGKLETFFSKSENKLLELIDKNIYRTKLDNALDKLEIKKINQTNWIVFFEIDNLNYEIPVTTIYPDRNLPHYWTMIFIGKDKSPEKELIIKRIKEQNFYKRIKE